MSTRYIKNNRYSKNDRVVVDGFFDRLRIGTIVHVECGYIITKNDRAHEIASMYKVAFDDVEPPEAVLIAEKWLSLSDPLADERERLEALAILDQMLNNRTRSK